MRSNEIASVLFAMMVAVTTSAAAQSPAHSTTAAAAPVVPGDYVIGADDALSIVFWRDKDMSADVVVRPDGKISLPLLNEVQAAGYTPEQLRGMLVEAASRFTGGTQRDRCRQGNSQSKSVYHGKRCRTGLVSADWRDERRAIDCAGRRASE